MNRSKSMTARDVSRELREWADETTAMHSQGFFKTGKGEYGEGDRFLGIRVPKTRSVAVKFRDLSLDECHQLLKSKFHEERLCALLILVEKFRKSNPDDRTEIFHFYLSQTDHINNWDLVDCSAYQIAGAYLEDKDRKILHELALSKKLWERRIAIVSTYHFIKRDDFNDSLKISEELLNDPHDLIHKAVGWMLREVGKRDSQVEKAFLDEHWHQMSRTTLRYAIERFPEPERLEYLARGKK